MEAPRPARADASAAGIGDREAVRWLAGRWLRRRWRAAVPLALMVAAGSAGTMLAIATAQRTAAAYDDYLERADVADVAVNPSFRTDEIDDVIRSLPGVERATTEALFTVTIDDGAPRSRRELEKPAGFDTYLVAGEHRAGGWGAAANLPVEVEEAVGRMFITIGSPDGGNVEVGLPIVRSGRLPTGEREVVLNTSAAESSGIGVGDVIPLAFWEGTFLDTAIEGDYASYLAEEVTPLAVEHAEVVGIVTLPDEVLPDNLYPRGTVILSGDLAKRYACPSIDVELATATVADLMAAITAVPCASNYTYYDLVMAGGARDVTPALDEFVRRAAALSPPPADPKGPGGDVVIPPYQLFSTETEQFASQVRRSIRPTVAALTVLGLTAAAITVALSTLAAVREIRATQRDQSHWHRLGLPTRHRALVAAAPILAAIAVGGGAGFLIGWSLDTGPIGVAGAVEPHAARRLSPVGAAAVAALCYLAATIAVLVSWRMCRGAVAGAVPGQRQRGRSPNWPPGAPAVADGIAAAYRQRTSVPVTAAIALLAGTLVATSVFAASMSALVSTPRSYGWPWDVAAMHGFGYESDLSLDDIAGVVGGNADVADWTAIAIRTGVTVNGQPLTALVGYDRTTEVDLPVLDGELPTTADEIAIGANVARDGGLQVGDTVEVGATGSVPITASVTGIVVLPTLGPFRAERTAPGVGALLAETTLSPEEARWAASFYGVRLQPGTGEVARARALTGIAATDSGGIMIGVGYPTAVRPSEIVDARSTLVVPIIVSVAFAIVSAASLAVATWASTRARRRELAILRTLGFSGSQLRTSIRVQAVATTAAALAVAAPVGVIVGRALWRAFASQLGVVTDPADAWGLVAAIVAAGVLVAAAMAEIPARIAGRAKPADGLHAE